MSKYTTEVRFICENAAGLSGSVGGDKVSSVIEKAAPIIFDFDFPIFDESYRIILEKKILRHFYTREIGFETVALWKLKLETKLNDIMPYYNQLYESTKLKFDPLHDIDYTREHNTDVVYASKSVDTNDSTKNTNDVNKYSATPQGTLSNVESGTYLTEATVTDNTERNSGTNSNSKDATNNEKFIERITGHNGGASTSKLLSEYRKTLLNIDMSIIRELDDLFMLIW